MRPRRTSAADRMQALLEFVRKNGRLSHEQVLEFGRKQLRVSDQTTYNYLNALERAGLIRVRPDSITLWENQP